MGLLNQRIQPKRKVSVEDDVRSSPSKRISISPNQLKAPPPDHSSRSPCSKSDVSGGVTGDTPLTASPSQEWRTPIVLSDLDSSGCRLSSTDVKLNESSSDSQTELLNHRIRSIDDFGDLHENVSCSTDTVGVNPQPVECGRSSTATESILDKVEGLGAHISLQESVPVLQNGLVEELELKKQRSEAALLSDKFSSELLFDELEWQVVKDSLLWQEGYWCLFRTLACGFTDKSYKKIRPYFGKVVYLHEVREMRSALLSED
ncbi:hypothetical protein KSP40_PGU008049 [Platanthera guangdongensis]|uniref:Uncharacterized protein n=1 Tax=Platanthera guangdongensis TaxID=2320717 RepID=A0ABR2N0V6_9ASPA